MKTFLLNLYLNGLINSNNHSSSVASSSKINLTRRDEVFSSLVERMGKANAVDPRGQPGGGCKARARSSELIGRSL